MCRQRPYGRSAAAPRRCPLSIDEVANTAQPNRLRPDVASGLQHTEGRGQGHRVEGGIGVEQQQVGPGADLDRAQVRK